MKRLTGEGPNQTTRGGERPAPKPGGKRGEWEEACAGGRGRQGWAEPGNSPGPGGKRHGAVASPREPLSLSGPQREETWARDWVFVLMDILKNTRCILDQRSQTQRLNMVCSVGIPMGRPVTSIQRDSPDLSHIGNIIDLKTFLFKL